MFNEKFLSIHIPKTGQEALLEKEIKKIGKQREKRINKKWDEERARYQNLLPELVREITMQDIEHFRKCELETMLVLISGNEFVSYYPYSDRMLDSEKRGVSYSKKYNGKILILGRFEESFLAEMYEAGELVSKVFFMENEVVETMAPELIFDNVRLETLIDEPIDEEDERYWQKEDFEKLDTFFQKEYHIFADEPLHDKLEQLKLVDDSDGVRIYDSSEFFEKQNTSA